MRNNNNIITRDWKRACGGGVMGRSRERRRILNFRRRRAQGSNIKYIIILVCMCVCIQGDQNINVIRT